MALEFEKFPQDIIDKVEEEHKQEMKKLKKQGPLTKQEMISLFNILNGLWDQSPWHDVDMPKGEYSQLVDRLDALTE